MAAAATIEQTPQTIDTNNPDRLVYDLTEMGFDAVIRQRTARLVAATLSKHAPVAELSEIQHPIESLHDAIQKAARGDKNAEKVIETNAGTDVIERTIKTGIVMDEVPLIVAGGQLMQYGQTLDSVQANSLKHASDHPIMRERTEAEARNAYRMQYLHEQGWFEDYSMLVVSRAENLPEAGFFTETMSCALQLVGKKAGILSIEPAFVSGIKKPDQAPHDAKTVVRLGESLGVDYEGLTPAEIIDKPILIHNSLIPNGAIDIVKLFDECAGGTFFGEDKPQEEYVAFRQKCREWVRKFAPKIQKIKEELIAEAPMITTRVQAVQRLHKISEKHMVEYALTDTTIDVRVFGREAAGYLEQARWHIAQGQHEQAQSFLDQAKDTAKSSSCPTGMNAGEGEANGELSKGKDQYGSLTFKCPKKSCGFINEREPGKLLPRCKKCKCDVSCG